MFQWAHGAAPAHINAGTAPNKLLKNNKLQIFALGIKILPFYIFPYIWWILTVRIKKNRRAAVKLFGLILRLPRHVRSEFDHRNNSF